MARRISFSGKHTESGIVAELLTLLETVTADGRITEPEAREIGTWLQVNRDVESIPGIEFLRITVEEILADGRVTDAERIALYKAVERVLPIEARRQARERRTAIDQMEKARARDERDARRQQAREERERDRAIAGANFMVAGVLYEGRADTVERYAREGQRVYLVREPANQFDPNAILVRLGQGYDIGYVPRDEAAALAELLDSGFPHAARITRILQGRRAPIPIVDADIYRKEAMVEKFLQSEVPHTEKKPSGCLAVLTVVVIVTTVAWIRLATALR